MTNNFLTVNALCCLKCSSFDVILNTWENKNTCTIVCLSCKNETILTNFTLSSINISTYQEEDLRNNILFSGKNDNSTPPWQASTATDTPTVNNELNNLITQVAEEQICLVHNKKPFIDVAFGTDMSTANVVTCCQDFRNKINKNINEIFKKFNIQSQMIVHNKQAIKNNIN